MLQGSYRGFNPQWQPSERRFPSTDHGVNMSTSKASNKEGPIAEQLGGEPSTAAADLVTEVYEEEMERLSLDVAFEILHVSRRRDVLLYLESHQGSARLDELAEFIAAKENDIEEWELTSSQRKRVYIGLYQCHLPKMHAAGIIEYNQPRGEVSLCPAAAQLYPYIYLDPFEEKEINDVSAFKRVLGLIGR